MFKKFMNLIICLSGIVGVCFFTSCPTGSDDGESGGPAAPSVTTFTLTLENLNGGDFNGQPAVVGLFDSSESDQDILDDNVDPVAHQQSAFAVPGGDLVISSWLDISDAAWSVVPGTYKLAAYVDLGSGYYYIVTITVTSGDNSLTVTDGDYIAM